MMPQAQWRRSRGGLITPGGLTVVDADLSTYTENDPGGYISVSSTKATVTNMPRTVDSYLYEDYGADAFSDNFETLFEIGGTAGWPQGALIGISTISNDVDDVANVSNGIGCNLFGTTPDLQLRIFEAISGSTTNTSQVITKGTTYWCKFVRDSSIGSFGRIYLYIATSEANRDSETWAFTIQQDLTAALSARYFYAVQSYNITGGDNGSFYIDHIDIVAD